MSNSFHNGTFVDLEDFIPDVHLDIRYATTNNFMGRAMYDEPKAFLVQEAAEALREASINLNDAGVGIVIWDAYRPFSVTRAFWDHTPEEHRIFVANPAVGSVHNRGCAIDMTLCDLSSGTYLEMPTDFDEFSPRSFVDFDPKDETVRENRSLLISTMGEFGFIVIPKEWWHFNFMEFENYPAMDLSFEELTH
jgi:D-alanyl-D-alanine dipeptidase